MLLSLGSGASAQDEKITPQALATLANSGGYVFTLVREEQGAQGIRRQIMSFEVDGLTQYALVLLPAGDPPEQGWPVLQFNHGFHPDPPRNGFNARGENDRPGDYYRQTVLAFASRGFAVVVPDYRGHNISEGGQFTSRALADAWYTRDAIACFLALKRLDGLDQDRAYMLGHSMGGAVTLRAMQALGPRVRAGSVWSTSGADGLAYLMRRELGALGEDHARLGKPALDDLKNELDALGDGTDASDLSPLRHAGRIVAPLSIQHAAEDASTPAAASLDLAARMYLARRIYQLKIYPGSDHLFTGDQFEQAVARDLAWFQRHR